MIIIIFILFSSVLYGQERRPYISKSYNDKYYGYGVPFSPINTPRKLLPGFKKNHSHRFGYISNYAGHSWFTYHYEIVW